MNSGIPTASGYEEKITFDEIEAAGGPDRQANQNGLLANVPEGNVINGWDVNVASVRQTSVKRTVRYHTHAEFIIRSKRAGFEDVVVGRRYGIFQQLHREVSFLLHTSLPGHLLTTSSSATNSLAKCSSPFRGKSTTPRSQPPPDSCTLPVSQEKAMPTRLAPTTTLYQASPPPHPKQNRSADTRRPSHSDSLSGSRAQTRGVIHVHPWTTVRASSQLRFGGRTRESACALS